MKMDYSVLASDGWLEFNARKWGLAPVKLAFSSGQGELPKIEAVVYTDRKGRIRMPKLSPYLPVVFESTPTESVSRLERQWIAVCNLMVDEFRARGVSNSVSFTPCMKDGRPWKWAGFEIHPQYTYYINLPYDYGLAEKKVRNRIRSCSDRGYTCERTNDMLVVIDCLHDTARRKHFQSRLVAEDLVRAQRLLGDALRVYVCFSPAGEACSARGPWAAGGDRDRPGSRNETRTP